MVSNIVYVQVLGRNLESVINQAMDLKGKWGDQFVSVEHLMLALSDDPRFGAAMFKAEGITHDKLEKVRWHTYTHTKTQKHTSH